METPAQYTTPQTSKSAVLTILEDRPIAYHPILAKALGGVKQAVFVSQLLYWTGKGKRADGFIWKTQEEWTDETGLSAYEQRTARKHLVKSGVLQEKLKSVPARLYYRLNTDVLQTRVVEYHEQVMKVIHNKSNTTLPAIPEITSEITTQEEPATPDSPVEDSRPAHEDPTFWAEGETPPEPSPHEPVEQGKARRCRELGTDPLGVAAVVEQNRAAAPHPDGGDASRDGDTWMDRPVREWCAFIGLKYERQSAGLKRMLGDDLRRIATTGVMRKTAKTPDETGEAIRKMTKSVSCKWLRSAGRPTHKEFTNVLINVLCGQVLEANGGASGGRNDTPQVDQAVAETMASLFDERGVRIRRE